eukprot:1090561-Prymnesium_polylepis.1
MAASSWFPATVGREGGFKPTREFEQDLVGLSRGENLGHMLSPTAGHTCPVAVLLHEHAPAQHIPPHITSTRRRAACARTAVAASSTRAGCACSHPPTRRRTSVSPHHRTPPRTLGPLRRASQPRRAIGLQQHGCWGECHAGDRDRGQRAPARVACPSPEYMLFRQPLTL